MIQEAPDKVRKYGINSQIQAYVYFWKFFHDLNLIVRGAQW